MPPATRWLRGVPARAWEDAAVAAVGPTQGVGPPASSNVQRSRPAPRGRPRRGQRNACLREEPRGQHQAPGPHSSGRLELSAGGAAMPPPSDNRALPTTRTRSGGNQQPGNLTTGGEVSVPSPTIWSSRSERPSPSWLCRGGSWKGRLDETLEGMATPAGPARWGQTGRLLCLLSRSCSLFPSEASA